MKRYLDPSTALIEVGSVEAVATSSFPVLTSAGRPLDLRLRERGGGFEPESSHIPLRISRSPLDGVTLGSAALGIAPAGGRGETGIAGSDDITYPNVDTDTDLVVEPRITGALAYLVLRSAHSPEDPALELRLPGGAQLREATSDAPAGALEIVRGGARIAVVDPPRAIDADGVTVRVRYDVVGSRIVLRVPHRAATYRYPILVDPEFSPIEDFRGWPDTNYWYAAQTNSWDLGVASWSWLWAAALGGVNYNPGDVGQWRWPGGGDADWNARRADSYIFRADTSVNYTPEGTRLVHAIYPDRGWELAGTGTTLGGYTSQLCVIDGCSPSGGSNGNFFVHSIEAVWAGQRWPAYSRLNYAIFYLRDRYAPSVGGSTHNRDLNAWQPTNTTVTTSAPTSDRGLGLRQGSAVVRTTGAIVPGTEIALEPCYNSGDRNHRCPLSKTYSFTYNTSNLAEGVNNLGIDALDMVGQKAPVTNGWAVKIDKSPPSATLSGSLYDERNVPDAEGGTVGWITSSHQLRVVANDGNSGVASAEVRIDGLLRKPADRVTQSCSTSGCPTALDHTFTFDPAGLTPGDHEVKVITRDQLANPNSITADSHTRVDVFTVHVGNGDPDPAFSDDTAQTAPDVDPNLPEPADDTTPPAHVDPLNTAEGVLAGATVQRDALNPLSDLNRILGLSGYEVTQIGPLTQGENPATGKLINIGASMVLKLTQPRTLPLDTTVPSYRPPWAGTTEYVPFRARMTANRIDDLFVDVDLRTNQIILISAGPESTETLYEPVPGTPPLPPEPDQD